MAGIEVALGISEQRPEPEASVFERLAMKPCPFCGRDGVVGVASNGLFQVGCLHDGCIGESTGTIYNTGYPAREAWNTRAS